MISESLDYLYIFLLFTSPQNEAGSQLCSPGSDRVEDSNAGRMTEVKKKQSDNNVFVLFSSLTLPVFIYFLHYSSFSQTPVPAAPVSMETAAGATAGRRGSQPTPASAPRATRGRGAIKSYWTCRLPTGTPPPPPLLSWPPPWPPPPLPPLSRHSQRPLPPPPPQRRHLPPCRHGNPNPGRGCWWCRGRRTG